MTAQPAFRPAPKPAPGKPRRPKRQPTPEALLEQALKAEARRYKRQCRDTVIRRAKGQCEYDPDGRSRCIDPGQDWHHSMGRGNKGIREPWASSPALTTWLCKRHHGQAHGPSTSATRHEVVEVLRLAAAARLGIVVDLVAMTPRRAITEHIARAA